MVMIRPGVVCFVFGKKGILLVTSQGGIMIFVNYFRIDYLIEQSTLDDISMSRTEYKVVVVDVWLKAGIRQNLFWCGGRHGSIKE